MKIKFASGIKVFSGGKRSSSKDAKAKQSTTMAPKPVAMMAAKPAETKLSDTKRPQVQIHSTSKPKQLAKLPPVLGGEFPFDATHFDPALLRSMFSFHGQGWVPITWRRRPQ